MALTERNGISIAQIVIYTPPLFIGLWLCIRHGFGRNAGWLYLVVFSLARLIGAAFQLATISDPQNTSLYVGAAILQTIGLTPLVLIMLGLIGRVVASIQKSTTSLLTAMRMRFIQVMAVVGLILSAIGGSDAGENLSESGQYTPSTLSQAGTGLMIAVYVLLVFCTIIVALQLSYVEQGEKRLVLAVGASLPFILVRLAYSAESVFGHNPAFSPYTGDVNIQLGMSVIMEIIVVAIVEGIGMTLKSGVKNREVDYEMMGRHSSRSARRNVRR